MALTPAEKLTVFEIIGIPFSNTYTTHDGIGTKFAGNQYMAAIWQTIKDEIDSYLADSSRFTGDMETRCRQYITRWDEIGTKTVSLDGGSVGSVSAITFNYESEREVIRSRIRQLVPFYERWRVAQMNAGGGMIPIIR